MVEPSKNGPGHEFKEVAAKQTKWDGFFNSGPSVSPDFLEERASQDAIPQPPVGDKKAAPKLADLMAEMPNGFPRVEGWDEMPDVGLEK